MSVSLGKTHEQMKRDELVRRLNELLTFTAHDTPSLGTYLAKKREAENELLALYDEVYKVAEENRARLATVGMELATARIAIKEREKEISNLLVVYDQRTADNTELLRRNQELAAQQRNQQVSLICYIEDAKKIRKKLRKLRKKRGKK